MRGGGGAPSSMLPVDTVFGRAITHWHNNFQQAVARPNDCPPRSRRAWYNVDGLPMTTGLPKAFLQVENPELPKIQRQQPCRILQARVPINRLREIESGARESISVINYLATYSHVLTQMMGELMNFFESMITDLRAFAPFAECGGNYESG